MPAEKTILDEIKDLRDRVALLERQERGSWGRDGTPLEQLRQTYLGNVGTGVASLASNEAMVCCDLWRSAALSVADSTSTYVDFDTEVRDYGNMWAVANPTRITIRLPGPYVVFGQCRFAQNTTGRRLMQIVRDRTEVLAYDEEAAPPATRPAFLARCRSVYIPRPCYLEMLVWQNSGGALNLESSSQFSPGFGAVLVRGG